MSFSEWLLRELWGFQVFLSTPDAHSSSHFRFLNQPPHDATRVLPWHISLHHAVNSSTGTSPSSPSEAQNAFPDMTFSGRRQDIPPPVPPHLVTASSSANLGGQGRMLGAPGISGFSAVPSSAQHPPPPRHLPYRGRTSTHTPEFTINSLTTRK